MKQAIIKTKTMPIKELKPHPRNPRVELTPDMPAYKKLKDSMTKFNYVDPIIWNEATGLVVGGHQRLTILKNEGYDEATVAVVNIPNPNEELALVIALNKIEGEWDVGKLAEAFTIIDTNMETFTGFEKIEIENILTTLPDFNPEREWKGMPEFNQKEYKHRRIIMHFETEEDVQSFANLIGQTINERTKYLWYPYKKKEDKRKIKYSSEELD